jgi:hypothetical protein
MAIGTALAIGGAALGGGYMLTDLLKDIFLKYPTQNKQLEMQREALLRQLEMQQEMFQSREDMAGLLLKDRAKDREASERANTLNAMLQLGTQQPQAPFGSLMQATQANMGRVQPPSLSGALGL